MTSAARRELLAELGLPQPDHEPTFLSSPVDDAMLEMILALGAELWIERDRRRVLETLLAERGIVAPEDIEAHRDDAEGRTERERLRAEFVRRVLSPLKELPQ